MSVSQPIFISTATIPNSVSHDFEFEVKPPIRLNPDKKHLISLQDATMWYSWETINASKNNNTFKYTLPDGTIRTVTLSGGAYNIDNINASLKNAMIALGDANVADEIYDLPLWFEGNDATQHVTVRLAQNYTADFRTGNFYEVLGLEQKIYLASEVGLNESGIDGDIDTVQIHTSLVNGSCFNGTSSNVIYSSVVACRMGLREDGDNG
jgi:hypothetical protein